LTITKEGGTYVDQVASQIVSLIITLVISLLSGALGGYLVSLDIFQPVHALFRDDDHFYDVIHKYPKSYLHGTDEHYHETKSTLVQIKEFLQKAQAAHKGEEAFSFQAIATKVWNDHNTSKE
jgi:hypothetical protein